MKVTSFILVASLCVLSSCKSVKAVVAPAPNQQASFLLSTEEEQEINSVIAKMSLAEKVGQTCQITLDVLLKTNSDGSARTIAEIDEEKLKEAIDKYKVGSVLNVGSHTLSLAEWEGILKAVHRNYQQGLSKVPIIYGVDAIHGVNYSVGGTLFPQEIGLAATWNPLLASSFGEITAYELLTCVGFSTSTIMVENI
jgi:beta-glucosidase